MHCHICDREDDMITLDRRDMTFSPCRTCQEVIYDTVQGFEKSDEVLEEVE